MFSTTHSKVKKNHKVRGARSQSAWSLLWRGYMRHHRLVAVSTLMRMLATPLPTLMTVSVIAMALTVPFSVLIVVDNARTALAAWDDRIQLSVFLHDIPEEAGRALALEWSQRADIEQTEYISEQEGLVIYNATIGFDPLLNGLDHNPLPAVVVVYPTIEAIDELGRLKEALQSHSQTEWVQLDMEWVNRLQTLLILGERMMLALLLALAFAVLLVMLNTIRLMIATSQDEIVVTKLVGATNAFIRRPFLYIGFWIGLGAGLLAVLVLCTIFFWMQSAVQDLLALYQSDIRSIHLDWTRFVQLVMISTALSWAGAWLAVTRYLYSTPHQLEAA